MLPRRLAPLNALLCLALLAVIACSAATLGGCALLGLGSNDPKPTASGARAAGDGDGLAGEIDADTDSQPQVAASVDQTTPITSEEVSFASGADTLSGTLYRPIDDAIRRPAVILLHDFGPTGRDGLFRRAFGVSLPVEVAVYRGVAERLASHGFVVLTYDKRTCVKSAAPWCEYPRRMVEDHRDRLAAALVEDASAAMAYVSGRDEVDPSQLHLIGHGHGADIALAVEPTGRRVLLAPSPHPADALIRHQTSRSIEALEAVIANDAGTTSADLWKRQLAELKSRQSQEEELFAAIRAGQSPADAFGLSAEAWRGLIALHDDAMDQLASPRTPVLAVMGELDLDLPEGSQEELAEALSSEAQGSGVQGEDSRLVVVPALTHLMVDAGEGADPTLVSEAVIAVILDFLVP